MALRLPEEFRVAAFDAEKTLNGGAFSILLGRTVFHVIASIIAGWEHVTAYLPHRAITESEENQLADIFWEPNDVIVKFPRMHSTRNHHMIHMVHLWRPVDQTIPVPPREFSGAHEEAHRLMNWPKD
jgi:hypothetical protein